MYSKSVSTSPYIETFKGVDGYFAVDMSHLSVQQTESLRKAAGDGDLSQAEVTAIFGDDTSAVLNLTRLEDMWELPPGLKLVAQDSDGNFNPTLLALMCFQLLQDAHQDLRALFMEFMFNMQDQMLKTAQDEKAAGESAAASGFASALCSACAGMAGGFGMAAGAGGGSLRHMKLFKSENEKLVALGKDHDALTQKVKDLGSPGENESVLALQVQLVKDNRIQREADATRTEAALQTKTADLDVAVNDRNARQAALNSADPANRVQVQKDLDDAQANVQSKQDSVDAARQDNDTAQAKAAMARADEKKAQDAYAQAFNRRQDDLAQAKGDLDKNVKEQQDIRTRMEHENARLNVINNLVRGLDATINGILKAPGAVEEKQEKILMAFKQFLGNVFNMLSQDYALFNSSAEGSTGDLRSSGDAVVAAINGAGQATSGIAARMA